MTSRTQSRFLNASIEALNLCGLGATGLRLRLSRGLSAAFSALRKGSTGELLSLSS
jgi:hypothetical protein